MAWALRLLAVPLALAMAAGCQSDLELPTTARVSCGAAGSCPPGFVCNPGGRCERADALDRDPPALVDGVHVSPPAGKVGTRFEVAFDVTEPLGRRPEVTVDLEGRIAPLRLESEEGLSWLYSWEATGREPEGIRELALLLTDTNGNETRDTSASLVFDFTVPRLVGEPELDSAWVSDGDVAILRFVVSEPLPAPPEVSHEGGGAWQQQEPEEGVQVYHWLTQQGRDEGAARVLVDLRDAAGNEDRLTAGTLTFDHEPPGVARHAVDPPFVREGAALEVRVEPTEPLLEPPELRAREPCSLELGQPEPEGEAWVWLHEVRPDDAGGDCRFSVRLADLAGNEKTVLLPDTVQVDRTPPQLAPGTTWVEPGRPLRAGDGLQVGFRVQEELARPPRLRLGQLLLGDPEPDEQDPLRWLYHWEVEADAGLGDGAFGLVVELADRAGNVTTDTTTLPAVTLDFTPPSFRSTVTPARPGADGAVLVGGQDVLEVTIHAREELASPPELELGRTGGGEPSWEALDPPEAHGLGYTFRRTVGGEDGLEDGRWALRVTLSDLAGNEVREAKLEQALEVDRRAPDVSWPPEPISVSCRDPLEPERSLETGTSAREGSEVRFSFATDELPAEGTLDVRVGDTPTERCACVRAACSCVHAVRPQDPGLGRDGPVPVAVTLRDAAGNPASENLGSVTLDYREPELAGRAFLQREDARQQARVAPDEVWARAGTTVTVTFALDEPALLPPRVEVAGRVFAPARFSRGQTSFEVAVPDPGAQDRVEVRLSAVDLAGNLSEGLRLGHVRYDREAPAAPDTVSSDRIVYQRVPWGREATAGRPLYAVRGEAGAVEGGGTVEVWDGEGERSALLGHGPAEADGSFSPVELSAADRPLVWISVRDAAGNGSPRVPVRHVEWVATLGGKVAGRLDDNPHLLAEAQWSPAPLQHWALTEVDGEAVAREDGRRLVTEGGGAWRLADVPDGVLPDGRAHHAAAWDPARDRLVVFSGYEQDDDLWERDGESGTWSQVCGLGTPCAGPPACAYCHLVYDSTRGRLLLLSDVSDELWAWDGAERQWERLCAGEGACGPGPGSFLDAGVAWDGHRARLVMHRRGRTWEWDGASWTSVTTEGPPSDARRPLTWDGYRRRVVLFGRAAGSGPAEVLWEYDGELGRWEVVCDRNAGCEGPRPANQVRQIWDAARRRTVMHAIVVGDETWEWDGEAWEQICGAATGCSTAGVPTGAELTWDPLRRRVVLYGGEDAMLRLRPEVWQYDGHARRWLRTDGPDLEGPRLQGSNSMALDRARGRVVLHGAPEPLAAAETWEWDPAAEVWEPVCAEEAGCDAPSPRVTDTLVWDPVSGRSLLFGELRTWAWDGGARTWTQLCGHGTGCDNPRHAGDRRAVWDRVRSQAVVVNGRGEVRAFSAERGAWWDVCLAGQGCTLEVEREDFAAVHAGGSLWLFGGAGELGHDDGDELFRLGEAGWRRVWDGDAPGLTGPRGRHLHDVVLDADRGSLLVFGGFGLPSAHTWEWRLEDAGWEMVCDKDSCDNPSERIGPSMVPLPDRAGALLYGGRRSNDDTWVWTHSRERPTQRLSWARFDTRPGADWTVTRVVLRVRAGGTGWRDGRQVDGVRLRLWDEGAFRVIAENAAPPEAPSLLVWDSADAGALRGADPWFSARAFRFGRRGLLPLAVEPLADNGARQATVATDYAEVVVRYTRDVAPVSCGPHDGSACPEGACYPDETLTRGVCRSPGRLPSGAECAGHTSCGPGRVCWAPAGEPRRCRQACDARAAHAGCAAGWCRLLEGRLGACMPQLDCEDAAAVQAACAAEEQDPCTCAAADPCGWSGDGVCQARCGRLALDANLDESGDCLDCGDADAVAAACESWETNNCTCSSADPCSFEADGWCDEDLVCAALFPADHFDPWQDCVAW